MSNKKKMNLAIFGAGGFAKESWALFNEQKNIHVECFVDIAPKEKTIKKIPIVSEKSFLKNYSSRDIDAVFVAVSDMTGLRQKIYQNLSDKAYKFAQFVHSSCVLMDGVLIGEGTVLYPFVSIQADSTVGRGVLINTAVTIGHDCRIGDFVTLNPGVNVAGNVHIKKNTFVGMGANIVEKVTVGENAVIGAGAVILDDVPDNVVVVGVPGKVIKKRD